VPLISSAANIDVFVINFPDAVTLGGPYDGGRDFFGGLHYTQSRNLARTVAESGHGVLYSFCFLRIYLRIYLLILTIRVRPIVSKSTGPIFANFQRW